MQNNFLQSFEQELFDNIVPFWSKLKDSENGGFYGYVQNDGSVIKNADKGILLQCRIVWFFSALYEIKPQKQNYELAKHGLEYLKNYCFDQDGLVVWLTDYQGKKTDKTKHIYYQSFALYALSRYYQSFLDDSVKKMADSLYNLIEKNYYDSYGYKEQLDNMPNRLADCGIACDRTMNALLHLLEAYTQYYIACKNNNAKDSLKRLLDIFHSKIYDSQKQRFEVFFDNEMNSVTDYYSFGHDIEAAWLLDLAAKSIADEQYILKISKLTDAICKKVYNTAFDENALMFAKINNYQDSNKVWWVQAEGVLGFFKNFIRSGNLDYLSASKKLLDYIKKYFINHHTGEWFWLVDNENRPDYSKPLVCNWKCPYHNGRMCIEMIKELRCSQIN
ncbi:MAG TPA: AGE family epimerase/isomerase [Clostridia bacterium]